MKILSVSQIKSWDKFTISHEPVPSIDLMERAANACSQWILKNIEQKKSIKIFCGKGNNGGDGLAIARLLAKKKYKIAVYLIDKDSPGSDDFEMNLERLKKIKVVTINSIENKKSFPGISEEDVIIDALFGTGLNKKPRGLIADIIEYINTTNSKVISIDIPSGLYVDKSSKSNPIIKATETLTFQNQKLAFLMPENEVYFGKVTLLDIELSKEFENNEETKFEWIDEKFISSIYQPRSEFSNKGTFGYACLLAGSYGMMGAAVLSSRACLRSGVGKLTTYTCEAGYTVFQTCVPEAMCKVFGKKYIKDAKDFRDFDVIGIGPGIGKYDSHKVLLKSVFENFKKPLVIDADALNIL
ncbi:MAG: NAD(P)H-hydrate epimerase, partial [Ginsengibacter sp.]